MQGGVESMLCYHQAFSLFLLSGVLSFINYYYFLEKLSIRFIISAMTSIKIKPKFKIIPNIFFQLLGSLSPIFEK